MRGWGVGVKLTLSPFLEKTSFKNPSLIRVKKKSINHVFFIEIASCKKKVVSSKYGGMVAMVKDCKFLNLGFRFIRRNKIYKAKISKKS